MQQGHQKLPATERRLLEPPKLATAEKRLLEPAELAAPKEWQIAPGPLRNSAPRWEARWLRGTRRTAWFIRRNGGICRSLFRAAVQRGVLFPTRRARQHGVLLVHLAIFAAVQHGTTAF